MGHALCFRFVASACLAGALSGVLLADGTFINFRGDEVRRAIERLREPGQPWLV